MVRPNPSPPAPPLECPCGGGRYAQCCARFIDGGELPASAEQLMRSRYTAYVLARGDYLRATWHASTAPAELGFDDATRWLGLQIRQHVQHDATHAEVEFVARYKVGGRAYRLHERSRFERVPPEEGGRWLYLDGTLFD